ncbi:hypothetical protein TVAG_348430 [Trichomonas vaginalis G3]|uniref:Surface antigen BspA-like n=1 Tax=Trichomonas vaginalis (strain ATCC PRA-98 / G3) TaxID=412133 RepID=A2DSY4_TRIV3|nr:hypothetical protein TVAG_348430 [Trichomonas vaginalis G3]|eukprot:XP_001328756.1 hypothetical protein [Trichomonas vaginalis G3]
MFSCIITKHLLKKTVTIESQVTITGTKMILNDNSDFVNSEELLTRMQNENIDTIRLEGSSITDFPAFIGIQMVKSFECDITCDIPEYYFSHNQNIKTVIIGNNVENIKKEAFSYSTLESIEISSSTKIGENAFAYCTNLKVSNIHQLGNGVSIHIMGTEALRVSLPLICEFDTLRNR